MKSDILVSGVTAVAIHALIFSLSLSNIKNNNTDAHIYEPISISIISPREFVTAPPPADNAVKPHAPAKSKVFTRQALIPRKEIAQKKRLMPKADPKPGLENKLEFVVESPGGSNIDGRIKQAGGGGAVKTASISGHILKGEREKIGAPQGNPLGGAIIVEARPKYKENPAPHYPKVARRKGYEGRTLLRVEVLESGKVGRIEIATSSGFEILDKAALQSVNAWTFVPGTKNGKTAKQWVMVPIRFSLR